MSDTAETTTEKAVGHPAAVPTNGVHAEPFVIRYQMEETLPCAVAIDYANRDDRWYESRVGGEDENFGNGVVDPVRRDSEQLVYMASAPPLEFRPMLDFAGECLDDYLAALPIANNFPLFKVQEMVTVLRYAPGQGYHHAHSDYTPANKVTGSRHLTFVLFLNSQSAGGELEFVQQGVRVEPVEGRGVIFPSGWTHAHRSLPAAEDRYVFQMWWSFQGPTIQ